MSTPRNHAFRERQSLALNSAVAARLAEHPNEVLERASKTVARWKSLPGVWCVDLGKWEEILAGGDAAKIARILTGSDEFSVRLRQSSPFSVQLSPQERWKILRETTPA